jgi:hypothetical protein
MKRWPGGAATVIAGPWDLEVEGQQRERRGA